MILHVWLAACNQSANDFPSEKIRLRKIHLKSLEFRILVVSIHSFVTFTLSIEVILLSNSIAFVVFASFTSSI
jgi:hypothetical protein